MASCHACGTELAEDGRYCPSCGTDQNRPSTEEPSTPGPYAGRTGTNALIGGIIGFFLAMFVGVFFTPLYVLGILAGAATAGYLHEAGEVGGAKVGILAGFVATAPVILVVLLGAVIGAGTIALGALGHLGPVHGGLGIVAIVVLVFTIVTLATLANVIFGAMGGFIGGALGES